MPNDITQILAEVTSGNRDRMDELFQLLYQDLKAAAAGAMQGERVNHSLQPTALVHQVYLKLVDQTRVDWKNRSHFCAVASTLMRRILVDHARARHAEKRGGLAARVTFDEALVVTNEERLDFIALDDALRALSTFDERKSRVIELRFFGGLSVEETAAVLKVSPATVMGDWRLAKAWLKREMRGDRSHDA